MGEEREGGIDALEINGCFVDLRILRLTKIYTLTSVLGEWVVEPKAVTFSSSSLSNPIATFVISSATGEMLNATADALRQALAIQNTSNKHDAKMPTSVWIAVSQRAIRAHLDINGERIGKVDVPESDAITSALILNKNGTSLVYVCVVDRSTFGSHGLCTL